MQKAKPDGPMLLNFIALVPTGGCGGGAMESLNDIGLHA